MQTRINSSRVAQIFLQNHWFYKGNTVLEVVSVSVAVALALIIFENYGKIAIFFSKSVRETSAKLNTVPQNIPRKLPQNWLFITNPFSTKICPENFHEFD